MSHFTSTMIRKGVVVAVLTGSLAALTASQALGALINGSLPATGFTFSSVTDNSVTVSSSSVTLERLASLKDYVARLTAIQKPTAGQKAALATYTARLADAQARYDAGVDLRESASANIKTTYSRVPPSLTFESGWHYHNGPVIVTVTAGAGAPGTVTSTPARCLGHARALSSSRARRGYAPFGSPRRGPQETGDR
jgi:hypothetical protein